MLELPYCTTSHFTSVCRFRSFIHLTFFIYTFFVLYQPLLLVVHLPSTFLPASQTYPPTFIPLKQSFPSLQSVPLSQLSLQVIELCHSLSHILLPTATQPLHIRQPTSHFLRVIFNYKTVFCIIPIFLSFPSKPSALRHILGTKIVSCNTVYVC